MGGYYGFLSSLQVNWLVVFNEHLLTIILGELTIILGELLVIYELVVQLLHIFNSNTYLITFSSVMLIDYSHFSSIPVMLFDYSLFSSVIIINNSLFVSNAHRLFTFFISNYWLFTFFVSNYWLLTFFVSNYWLSTFSVSNAYFPPPPPLATLTCIRWSFYFIRNTYLIVVICVGNTSFIILSQQLKV